MITPLDISEAIGIESTLITVLTDGVETTASVNAELTPEQQAIIDEMIEPEKVTIKRLKEEAKALKAENKLLRDRIADATDFTDLKTKLTAIKDSEEAPVKWTDKTTYLQGQRVEHKGFIYEVTADHTANKAAEPGTSDLYRPL